MNNNKNKIRLDELLIEKKIVNTIKEARFLIMNYKVFINNELSIKSGLLINKKIDINKIYIKKNNKKNNKFVSRGGIKLEKALEKFNININNLICLDIGSSTGGFTDCLLQNNAKLVYAIDIGTNQLSWKLRNNNKVIIYEKTNFCNINKKIFKHEIEFVCCDVSFISIKKILISLKKIISNNIYLIFLIKPQFEIIKNDNFNNENINSNKLIYYKVIKKIINLSIINNFNFLDLYYSPISGNKKSNIEFICLLQNNNNNNNLIINKVSDKKIIKIINKAILFFKK